MDANLYLKSIPMNAQPTDVLAARFATWRKIIRALNVYFREVATVQDEVIRQNVRLGHAINIPFFDDGSSEPVSGTNGSIRPPVSVSEKQKYSPSDFPDHEDRMFLSYGNQSIGDVPANLIQFHRSQAAAASRTSKELTQNLIPRLEDLRRDLLVKIKEIKNLSSDFRNSVSKEQANTDRDYRAYVNAIEVISTNPSSLSAKHDPYLLKPNLEKQINRQVNEENYLLEAFLNLQGSGQELEKVVAQEVQQALSVFAKLFGLQGQNINELLVNKIVNGYVSKDPAEEWNSFIKRDENFVDPNLKPRRIEEVKYKYQDNNLASELRTGYLERRSKYLKSYSRAWYVLTPSFLHEFKSNDRKHDPYPVMSLSLDDCQITHDPKSSSSHSHKFILNAKQSGNSSNRGHNWVFRAESKEKMEEWYKDISDLTSLSSPVERVQKLFKNVPVAAPVVLATSTPGGSFTGASVGGSIIDRGIGEGEGIAGAGSAAAGAAGGVGAAGIAGAAAAGGALAGALAGTSLLAKSHDQHSHHSHHSHRSHNTHASSIRSHTPQIDENGDTYIPVVKPISSPVPSDTSGVTSNGEPYQEESERQDDGTQTVDNSVYEERPNRGRFPSEVNLEHKVDADKAIDEETLHREAATFIVPSDLPNTSDTAVDDQTSVFSYDLTHSAATLPKDRDFQPVGTEIPVEIERRLTETRHKEEDGIGIGVARHPDENEIEPDVLISRRRSSVASQRQRPLSRKPTGSYGTTDELKPLTNVNGDSNEPPPLFFTDGLPSTTGGADDR